MPQGRGSGLRQRYQGHQHKLDDSRNSDRHAYTDNGIGGWVDEHNRGSDSIEQHVGGDDRLSISISIGDNDRDHGRRDLDEPRRDLDES